MWIKRCLWFSFLLSISTAVISSAQSDQEVIRVVALAPDHEVVVLPRVSGAVQGEWQFGDTVLAVDLYEDRIRFRATIGDYTRTQWVSKTDKNGRFAFDQKTRKFRRMENSVRVQLDDYDQLPQIVEEVEAHSGRAFPGLDFAVVQLPRDADVLEFRDRLASQGGVKSAIVMFQMPLNVPM